MALNADKIRPSQPDSVMAFPIQNGVTVYAGSYLSLGLGSHGTAAKRGRVFPFVEEAGSVPLGFCKLGGVGTADGAVEATVEGMDEVLERLDVAALAGDETDVGKPVYLLDDDSFTLTLTTTEPEMGIVKRPVSSSQADVLVFGASTQLGRVVDGTLP